MKTLSIKRLVVFLFVLVIANSKILASDNFTKEFHQNYTIKINDIFQVSNKYGQIHIENWDKNEISIDVIITVEASSKEKAEKIFEKIEIIFGQNDSTVKAITEIKGGISAKTFNINYKVKMPKSLRLKLFQSYGSVYIQEVNGKSEIEVRYGSLKADNLLFGDSKPRSILDLEYSSGNIRKTDWLKIKVGYSSLKIENGDALIVKSKYSDMNFSKVVSIVTDSKYDSNYKIGTIDNFVCIGEYSHFKIDEIRRLLECDIKFGDIKINKISDEFEKSDLTLKYSNAKMLFSKNASYAINAEISYGDIVMPESENIKRTCSHTESSVTGIVGKSENPKTKIKVLAKYSNVDLK